MILAEIRGYGERRNLRYRRERSSWPIAVPKKGLMHKEDENFDNLWKEVKKPTHKAHSRTTWISEAT